MTNSLLFDSVRYPARGLLPLADPLVLEEGHDGSAVLGLPLFRFVAGHLIGNAHRGRHDDVGWRDALLLQGGGHINGALHAQSLVERVRPDSRGKSLNLDHVARNAFGLCGELLQLAPVLRIDLGLAVTEENGHSRDDVVVIQVGDPTRGRDDLLVVGSNATRVVRDFGSLTLQRLLLLRDRLRVDPDTPLIVETPQVGRFDTTPDGCRHLHVRSGVGDTGGGESIRCLVVSGGPNAKAGHQDRGSDFELPHSIEAPYLGVVVKDDRHVRGVVRAHGDRAIVAECLDDPPDMLVSGRTGCPREPSNENRRENHSRSRASEFHDPLLFPWVPRLPTTVRTYPLLARRAPTTAAAQMTSNQQIPAQSVRPAERAA